jgi:hypothetical protein
MTLKQQVNAILHAKVNAIAKAEYAKANPIPGRRHKPYTLPACAYAMVEMLGRIEVATDEELESFAHFATTGEVAYITTKGK